MYNLHSSTDSISSAAIVAELNRDVPLHRAHIASIERLEAKGMSYSGEDGDVLSAAWTVAQSGRTEPHAFECAWVEANS